MADTPGTPRLLTAREVAQALRVHQRTAYRLITGGSIKAIKVGSQWRVPEEALAEFIESGGKNSAQEKPKSRGQKQCKLPLGEE